MSIEVEYDFVKLSDEEISEAIVADAKIKALIIMYRDLKDYINKMGKDASFKGWITHICPENVTIDPRLDMPGSEWRGLWNKVKLHGKDIFSIAALKTPTHKRKKLSRSHRITQRKSVSDKIKKN